ncbi:MAG: PspA-associated protein PspAA [Candidatus Aquicultor sp.]
MIIRITNDGQYRVKADEEQVLREIDEVDNQIVQLFEKTEKEFHALMNKMVEIARKNSERLPEESIEPSQYVLPPQDLSLCEGYEIFKGVGIIAA